MLAHGRNELSPFCRMPSQSNKLYKPVRETSDHAEQGMSPFRKEQSLHKRRMAEDTRGTRSSLSSSVRRLRIIIPAAESIIARGQSHPFVDQNTHQVERS